MAPEGGRDPVRLAEREIVALAHVVQAAQFQHQVMHAVASRLQQGERVVARIDMEEVGLERAQHVVAELETEQVLIERHHRLDTLDGEHRMSHAERSGDEAGYGPAGLEGRRRRGRAVKRLEPVAGGILEAHKIRYATLVDQPPCRAAHRDATLLKPGRQRVECRGVGDFPAEKRGSAIVSRLHDQPLPLVVHPERDRGTGAIRDLQSQQARAERDPVVQIARADADVAQRANFRHGFTSAPPGRRRR